MANTVTINKILNGPKDAIINLVLKGDGTGDETATVFADVSDLGCTNVRIAQIWPALQGFSVNILGDATTDLPMLEITEYTDPQDFRAFGGIKNTAIGTTGATGDLVFTTLSLSNGDKGNIVFHLRKY